MENTVLDLESILSESDPKTPLLCLLSVGSDPTNQIEALAKSQNHQYHGLSMGQGQEDAARRMLQESIQKGHWLMLQNCHLH